MERTELEVAELTADDRKRAYLLTKGVSFVDVLEVFLGHPRYFHSRSVSGERFAILGPNKGGRFLLVPILPGDSHGVWRVVTAYWLNERRARRFYGTD